MNSFFYMTKLLRQFAWERCAVLLCLCICSGGSLWAQKRSPHEYVPPPSPTGVARPDRVLLTPDEDYRLAPGDTIDVLVEDAPELSQPFRLTASGEFEMPVIGLIKAQGRTSGEIAKSIVEALRRERYLKQPLVKVTVQQYGSQFYFVQGAVRQPGVLQTEGRPSLVKLISLAGGLLENHGPEALILRPLKTPQNGNETAPPAKPQTSAPTFESGAEKEKERYEVIRVSLNSIYQQGRFDQNFKIEPGDIVEIPPANVFYVAGEVNSPGAFQMKEGTTLRQAISLAQGTTFKAKLGEGLIFRDDLQTGRRQEIRVHIGDVMNGKREDIIIQPNDIVIVPNSRVKSVTNALLNALGVNSARIPMRY